MVQAILVYPINLFKFTMTICNELDATISSFWWGQKQGETHIHWVSKEKLGRSKADRGLGFKSFVDFNDALLAKQCWRLINEPNSIWALVPKAHYFPKCSFLDAKRGGKASWAWSSLLAERDILLRGTHWQIMNGSEVQVWVDRWIPSIPSSRPSSMGTAQVSHNARVDSLIYPTNEEWDIYFLKPFVSAKEFDAILKTHSADPLLRYRLV